MALSDTLPVVSSDMLYGARPLVKAGSSSDALIILGPTSEHRAVSALLDSTLYDAGQNVGSAVASLKPTGRSLPQAAIACAKAATFRCLFGTQLRPLRGG
jgi:hypothetical protein